MSEEKKISVELANFIYEQMAGATHGHMSMIPNNPVLWGLFSAHSTTVSNTHAITKGEFADILIDIADQIRR